MDASAPAHGSLAGSGWPTARDLRWPFLLTLGVTGARLTGELLHGPQILFGSAAGGGAALVGIGWLVPVFGYRFGRQLAAAQPPPAHAWRRALTGIALLVAVFASVRLALEPTPAAMATAAGGAIAAAAIAATAWPALGRWLLAYAVVARLPVVAITFALVAGDVGTHYEKLADGAAPLAPLPRALVLATAQAVFWLPITILGGLPAGLLAARRHRPTPRVTAARP